CKASSCLTSHKGKSYKKSIFIIYLIKPALIKSTQKKAGFENYFVNQFILPFFNPLCQPR
ncbi:hypothetical protein COU05_02195, partial [bacterium (Candidatus Gribaldobacteria) CG10_big_fil_rev_8_21_14_0_10_37_21]